MYTGKNFFSKSGNIGKLDIDVLNAFYAELGLNAKKHIKSINSSTTNLHNRVANSMFVNPITLKKIIKISFSLPSKQSYGYDEIPMSVIQKRY